MTEENQTKETKIEDNKVEDTADIKAEDTTSDPVNETKVEDKPKENEPEDDKKVPFKRFIKVNDEKRILAAENERLKKEKDELLEKTKGNIAPENEELIEQEVRKRAAAAEFVNRSNSIAAKAVKELGKANFDETLAVINDVHLLPNMPDVIEALHDMDNSSKVLEELSKDLDFYEKLVAMPPIKRVMELTKLSNKLQKDQVKKVSAAPAPLRTIAGSGARSPTVNLYDKSISTKDFIKERDRQVAERLKEKRGY